MSGNRPTGVTILAIIQILAGLVYFIAGAGIVFLGGVIGDIYGAIGGVIGFFFILLAVLEFVVAWGYLSRKGWARLAGLVLAGLGILEGLSTLPNGALTIILDAIVIYYLTRPHIVDWFAGKTPEAAQPPPPPPI